MKYTTTVDAIKWEGDIKAIKDFRNNLLNQFEPEQYKVKKSGKDLVIHDEWFFLTIPLGYWLVFDGCFNRISDDWFQKHYV